MSHKMTVTEQVFTREFLKSIRPEDSEPWQYLHWAYVDTSDHQDWSLKQQTRLEELLTLAQRYEQLDDDALHRLRSPDAELFWGKLNEFEIARFLESRQLGITFRPPGRTSHEGEFLVALPSREIFVEVKTMFPRLPEKAEERQLRRLCRAAGNVNAAAWINIQVLQEPVSDFRTKPFVQFLEATLPDLIEKGRDSNPAIYKDNATGLRVGVKFMSPLLEPPLVASPWTGVREVKDDDYIKASLRKASVQLPIDVPCIVALCSKLGHPPSPTVFHNALYGRFVVAVNWNREGEGQYQGARRDDGFFRRGRHSRISAVVFFDNFRLNAPPDLDIYHNPTPKIPLTPEEWAPLSERQWCAEESIVDGAKGLRIWMPYGSEKDTE